MTPDIGNISKFKTNNGIFPLVRLTTISSTNDYASELLKNNKPPDNLIIIAEHQTKGKGQMGRSWHTSDGNSLNLSYIVKSIAFPPVIFNMAIALGVLNGIRESAISDELNNFDFNIKWPNDIVVSRKSEVRKVAGILIENSWRGEVQTASIVGVGINVDTRFTNEISRDFNLSPGNLNDCLNVKTTARTLELPVINNIQNRIKMLSHNGGVAKTVHDFNNELFGLNIEREYTIDNKLFTGKLVGIEEDGRGIFTESNGSIIRVQSSNVVWSWKGNA